MYYTRMRDRVLEEVRRYFKPEFLNRIDEIIVFHSLGKEHVKKIADLMLEKVKERLKDKRITLVWTDNLREYLSETGFDPVYGARPLRRVIQKLIENPLAEMILSGELKPKDTIKIDANEKGVVFIRDERILKEVA